MAGQSLQEYLLGRLIEEASRPTLEELLDRVELRSGGRVDRDAAVSAVRAERDAR